MKKQGASTYGNT